MPIRVAMLMLLLLAAACSTASSEPPDVPLVANPLRPETIVWLQAGGNELNDVPTSVDLALGRGDGTILWRGGFEVDGNLPNGGIAFFAPPRGGVLAWGSTDGTATALHVVSAAQPQDRTIATVSEPVVAGSIDPSGDWLYLLTGVDPGAMALSRIATRGGSLESVASFEPEDLPLGGGITLDFMYWTPDGTRLLLQACESECWWHVIAVVDGSVMTMRPDGAEDAVGVTNDTLLALASDCAVGPCPFVLVDLESGETTPFDPHAHEARMALTAAGRTLVLYDNQGVPNDSQAAPQITVTAFDPETREIRVVFRSPSHGLPREGQGDWAPPGWFVVAGSGLNVGEGSGPILVRIADGFVVELPPLLD